MTKPAQTPGPSSLARTRAERTRAERTRRPEQARLAVFWLEAAVLVLFLAASAAPTPLYRVYQARWGFSATTLTAVFAVYVVFLLMTVLILGSLSDHVGRRPVIITALAVDTAACLLFLLAHGVGALFAGRALQGVAVGLAATALGAALLDLRPAGSLAPLVTSNAGTVGLALGALGTSVLVQYGPVPTTLVWWLLLGAFLAAIVLIAVMAGPGIVRAGALASIKPDVSVPRPARGTFARAVPCLVAVWALGGFYLSLGPSLAAQLSGSRNLLWGGVITFLLTGLGAVTASAFRNSAPIAVMLGGCLGLLGGAAVTIAAIVTSTPALLLLGTVLAGLGFGPGNLGAYRVIMARAAASNRAGMIAAVSIVNYLAFGLPALLAGVATSHFGLHDTALVYSAAIALLAAAAAGGVLFESRARARAPQAAAPPPELPPGPCTVPPCIQAAHQETEPTKAPK
jgi:MFS family permease